MVAASAGGTAARPPGSRGRRSARPAAVGAFWTRTPRLTGSPTEGRDACSARAGEEPPAPGATHAAQALGFDAEARAQRDLHVAGADAEAAQDLDRHRVGDRD